MRKRQDKEEKREAMNGRKGGERETKKEKGILEDKRISESEEDGTHKKAKGRRTRRIRISKR